MRKTTEAITRVNIPHSPVQPYAENNRKLSAAFDRWTIARHLSPLTRRAYDETLRYLLEFAGSDDIREFNRSNLGAFLASLHARGFSAATLERHTYGLRAIFRFLKLANVISIDPTQLIPHRRIQNKVPRCPSVQEVEKLIGAARSTRDRALVELMYATGVRVSELCGIRIEDLDFDKRKIVVTGKGNKQRLVLFGSYAAQAVRDYLAEYTPESGYLFESPKSPGMLYRSGNVWCGKVYVNGVQEHIPIGRVTKKREAISDGVLALLKARGSAGATNVELLELHPHPWMYVEKFRRRGHQIRTERRATKRNLLLRRLGLHGLPHPKAPARQPRDVRQVPRARDPADESQPAPTDDTARERASLHRHRDQPRKPRFGPGSGTPADALRGHGNHGPCRAGAASASFAEGQHF